MKKLLFVLAFTFIGGQAFSQMYMVLIQDFNVNNCPGSWDELTLTTITPAGVINMSCIPNLIDDPNPGLLAINQELNSIMSQGYKLINIDYGSTIPSGSGSVNGLQDGDQIRTGTTFYLAIP